MKKITKVMLMIAAVMMVATGCQKIDDDISVSLKSSGVQTVVNIWKSGNAAFECAAAGGDCSYAFKIDEWDEEYGMDGTFETMKGNTITILNSDGKTFDFTSEYPVCKVIVKAGRGAIIYTYPEGGVYEDAGLVGFQGKGISHVTFCYSEEPLVIAVKVRLSGGVWACTSGGPGEIVYEAYYNFIPNTVGYKTYVLADINDPFGNIIISDTDGDNLLEVTMNNAYRSDLLIRIAYLFVGTLDQYKVSYWEDYPYQYTPLEASPSVTFDLPF